jgi:hypothetical protein
MANATKRRTASAMIETLHAEGPYPEYADKLMLFGRLVGDWDIEGRAFDESGNVIRGVTGEWHLAVATTAPRACLTLNLFRHTPRLPRSVPIELDS